MTPEEFLRQYGVYRTKLPAPDSLWVLAIPQGSRRTYHYVARLETRRIYDQEYVYPVSPCRHKYHTGKAVRFDQLYAGYPYRLCGSCLRSMPMNPAHETRQADPEQGD